MNVVPESIYVNTVTALFGYLCGSIPFGYLLIRIFRGEDIRASGSGNIGATNVIRSGAKGLGIATLFLDAAKGALPVWLAQLVFVTWASQILDSPLSEESLMQPCWVALWAVLGHMFPLWLKFKGGKGVATALGVFAVMSPKATLVSVGVFLLVVAVTRYVSLGSILASLSMPFATYWLSDALRNWPSMLMVCIIAHLIVLKHQANIKRIAGGTEPKLGQKNMARVDDGGDS